MRYDRRFGNRPTRIHPPRAFPFGLVLIILLSLSILGCSKSKPGLGPEAHILESGTYTGGTEKESRQLQASVEKLSTNIAQSKEDVLASFSPSFDDHGRSPEQAVSKYFYPPLEAGLELHRSSEITKVIGELEGSEARLLVSTKGRIDIQSETGDRDRQILEEATYAYTMVREGSDWKVAALRPIDLTQTRGNEAPIPGLLVEAEINGVSVTPDGPPFTVTPGQEITLKCRFLGEMGLKVLLLGDPLDKGPGRPFLDEIDEDSRTYGATIRLRQDFRPGDTFLEISTDIRVDGENESHRKFTIPLRVEP